MTTAATDVTADARRGISRDGGPAALDHTASSRTARQRATTTLWVASLGFFLVTLDAVVLNVALPAIGSDLAADVRGLQWVVDGYTLVFAASLLTAGLLSDRIGAKRVMGAGLAIFAAASVVCAVSPDLGLLVAARFVQGLARDALVSRAAQPGLHRPDPPSQSNRLVGHGWRPCLVQWAAARRCVGPARLAPHLLAQRARGDSSARPARPSGSFRGRGRDVRPARQVLGAACLGALVYGLIEVGSRGATDPLVLAAAVVVVATAAMFWWTQRHVAHPLVPPALFASRSVVVAVLCGFAFMVAYFGVPFVMSLLLQQHLGLSPLWTGFVFAPMMIVGLVLTPVVPHVTQRTGARPVLVLGLASMTGGALVLASLGSAAPSWAYALALLLLGLGGPTVAPTATAVLLDAVPQQRAGIASGLLNTARQTGGALAVAVFGSLLAGPLGLPTGVLVSLLIAGTVSALAAAVVRRGLAPDATT